MPSTICKRGYVKHYDSNTTPNRLRISLKTADRRVALREKRKIDSISAERPWWCRRIFSALI
ncbi:MAG: hypothetical protein V3W14_03850 [Candidatus Neomarinimicrobiota bacterium]